MEQGKRVGYCAGGAGMILAGIRSRSLPGAAIALVGCDLLYRGIAGRSPLSRNGARRPGYGYGIKVQDSAIIHRSPDQLYRFWKDRSNLIGFLDRVDSIETLGDRASWRVRDTAGRTLEWDAEIIADRENEMIGWRTLEGGAIDHAGSLRFEPMFDGRSTRLTLSMQYNPPFGSAGEGVARLFGADLETWIRDEFSRFKSFAESNDLEMLRQFVANSRRAG